MNKASHSSLMRVAIYGCGQLAQMMVNETRKGAGNANIDFCFIASPGESVSCVEGMGDIVWLEEGETGTPPQQLFNALGQPDVVTVEREHVDTDLLRALAPFCAVHPNPDAVDITKNRAREKQTLQALGIPIAPFAVIDDIKDLPEAVKSLGPDVFIKSCEEGYDGKNQWRIKTPQDLEAALPHISAINKQLVVEKAIDFNCEVSIIGVRNRHGAVVNYPIAKNQHHDSILFISSAPCADLSEELHAKAQSYLSLLLEKIHYVGALAIELFVTDDEIYVNELAPRVHNSGHWTMTGATTSQFDNHIRAITGQNLGATQAQQFTAMINLIGVDDVSALAEQDNVDSFLYGKTLQAKRKMGHVNIRAASSESLREQVKSALPRLYPQATSQSLLEHY